MHFALSWGDLGITADHLRTTCLPLGTAPSLSTAVPAATVEPSTVTVCPHLEHERHSSPPARPSGSTFVDLGRPGPSLSSLPTSSPALPTPPPCLTTRDLPTVRRRLRPPEPGLPSPLRGLASSSSLRHERLHPDDTVEALETASQLLDQRKQLHRPSPQTGSKCLRRTDAPTAEPSGQVLDRPKAARPVQPSGLPAQRSPPLT